MNSLDILSTFTKVAPFFLIPITAYIINIIIMRISKEEISKAYNYIIKRMVEFFIVSIVQALITLYSSTIIVNSFVSSLTNITNIYILEAINPSLSLSAIISLSVSIILGIAILSIESERFVSPLIKEIENININNLGKVAIKLLDIISFILSVILVYSILLLAIFPTNITLISTIIDISQLYIYILIFDILSSIIVFTLNSQANYKDLLKNK